MGPSPLAMPVDARAFSQQSLSPFVSPDRETQAVLLSFSFFVCASICETVSQAYLAAHLGTHCRAVSTTFSIIHQRYEREHVGRAKLGPEDLQSTTGRVVS